MSGNLHYQSTTPDISEVIKLHIDRVLLDLNVCLPGKIVSYNSSTQYANVQIQLYQEFTDGSAIAPAVIPNVPVRWPRANGGKIFMHFPLSPGDDVMLVFSQRSLDNWKTNGGMNRPADDRKHHATDAYAIVGGSALPDAFEPQTTDSIELVNGNASFIIQPSGAFKL